MITVLIVDDSPIKCSKIEKALVSLDVNIKCIDKAGSINDAKQYLEKRTYDIVVLDMVLPNYCTDDEKETDGGISILSALEYSVESGENNYLIPSCIVVLTEYSHLIDDYKDTFTECRVFACHYSELSIDWESMLEKEVKKQKVLKNQNNNENFDERIVISVHGIRTNGKWQSKLSDKLGDIYKVIPYKYNFFPVFHFMSNEKVEKEVSDFINFIENKIREYPNAKIDFISHSFGTYITYNALSRINNKINIGKIILSGSVLRSDQDISFLYKQHPISKVINDCTVFDFALIAGQIFSNKYSIAGITGIKGSQDQIVNRYFIGGHSSFFKDTHMDEWVSAIKDNVINEVDYRRLSILHDIYYGLVSSKKILRAIMFITIVSLYFLWHFH